MRMRTMSVCVASSLVALGCSKGITRDRAKELLEHHAELAQPVSSLTIVSRDAYEAGVLEGLWGVDAGSYMQNGSAVLTAEGQKHFSKLSVLGDRTATLVSPARRQVVEITGLADAPIGNAVKECKFKWRYSGLSLIVGRYTGQADLQHDGHALLRLYDDGWRVEEVNLSETAAAAFRHDPISEERGRLAIQRRREAEDEAGRARAERERIARTPTHTIGTHTVLWRPVGHGETETWTVTVTDVSMDLEYKSSGGSYERLTVGCWELASLSLSQDNRVWIRTTGGINRAPRENTNMHAELMKMFDEIGATCSAWSQKYPEFAPKSKPL